MPFQHTFQFSKPPCLVLIYTAYRYARPAGHHLCYVMGLKYAPFPCNMHCCGSLVQQVNGLVRQITVIYIPD